MLNWLIWLDNWNCTACDNKKIIRCQEKETFEGYMSSISTHYTFDNILYINWRVDKLHRFNAKCKLVSILIVKVYLIR